MRYLSLLFLILLTACSFSLAQDITPPPDYRDPPVEEGQLYPLAIPDPASGAPIYAEKCAPCHGTQGLGDGPNAAQLTIPVAAIGSPQVARLSIPAEWFAVVRDGRMDRFMPGFTSLSDGERWDVLAYVYSFSSPPRVVARGKELFAASCAGCHGEGGRGDGPQAAGELSDFTDPKTMAVKSTVELYQAITSGIVPAMPAFEGQFSEEDRWALAGYIRSLIFSPDESPAVAAAIPPESSATVEPVQAVQATLSITQTQTAGSVTGSESITASGSIPGTGIITGKILNGSGGEAPEGLEVTVHGFDTMQLVFSDTVAVQAGGVYTLTGVDLFTGRSFLATTKYGLATYGSELGQVQDGQAFPSLDITVYDSTTEGSELSVDRMHMFFDFNKPGVIQVIELYIISNSGNKTVVAKEKGGAVLEFTLPNGATNLQFQDGALGERYLQTQNGFADTTPVRPNLGQHQVLFAFDLPYANKLSISQPVSLPVKSATVLFPEAGLRLKSAMLNDEGLQDFQGSQYRVFSSGSLQAGNSLDLTLSGQVGGGGFLPSLGDRSSLVIGLGALGLVLVVAGVILYRRSLDREMGEADESEATMEEGEEETIEGLMDAIIALDDLYGEGQLPEEAYRARRAELKERLRGLKQS